LLGYGAHTKRRLFWFSVLLAVVPADTRGVSSAERQAAAPANHESAFLGTLLDSLAGDAYQPDRWSPLPIDTVFSEGWDEPWVAGHDDRLVYPDDAAARMCRRSSGSKRSSCQPTRRNRAVAIPLAGQR
jgi:hypothetical protein